VCAHADGASSSSPAGGAAPYSVADGGASSSPAEDVSSDDEMHETLTRQATSNP
jgi:hypothetical protein